MARYNAAEALQEITGMCPDTDSDEDSVADSNANDSADGDYLHVGW